MPQHGAESAGSDKFQVINHEYKEMSKRNHLSLDRVEQIDSVEQVLQAVHWLLAKLDVGTTHEAEQGMLLSNSQAHTSTCTS